MTTTTDTPYDPAPHKMDLELFEESTRGDVATMRTSASADAIVDRVMSNPHLGDIVAAARDRDRAVVQAQRIQRDAAEVLRHRAAAIDALTAERDRLAARIAESDAADDKSFADFEAVVLQRDAAREQVKRWRVIAEGSAQALADLLALPAVRESQLRAGVAEIARIQRTAIDALNGGGR